MSKKFVFAGFLLVVGAVAAMYLWIPGMVHEVAVSSNEFVALHNRDEAYILCSTRKVAVSGVRKGMGQSGPSDVSTDPATLAEEVSVYHVRENTLRKHTVREMRLGGAPVIVDGTLYWTRGGDQLRMWRWSGTSFVELDAGEAQAVRAKYPYISDQLKKEGWEVLRYRFNAGRTERFSLALEKNPLELTCVTSEVDKGMHVVLTLRGPAPMAETVLLDLDTRVRPATPEEIRQIDSSKKGQKPE